jgi:Fe-S-cluster-containing dehydrogenase component
MKIYKFQISSGGEVCFDLSLCKGCTSKACVKACNQLNMGKILKIENGLPQLSVSEEEAKRGACTECLSCELDCRLEGKGGVQVILPQPDLERYLKKVSYRLVYQED